MKLSFVAAALVSLCLLCACAFPVLEEKSPLIIGPNRIQMEAHPGKPLILNCEAYSGSDLTLIYWLVNGSYPELCNSDRMLETDEVTLVGGTILQRCLVVNTVTREDLRSSFMCVVINSAGAVQKHITLSETGSDPITRLNATEALTEISDNF
ncbi:interleukin-18 receptor accessory protein-like [Genypterus blacodes]|uniref:interleukin-18 receptor accessory protein-like n=1 Tax=Genypterus blacodes TaxID=154954 RepID=UPI003F7719BA